MRRSLILTCALALVSAACAATPAPSWSFGPAGTPFATQSPPVPPAVTPGPASPVASVTAEVAVCSKASAGPLVPVLQVTHGDTGVMLLVGPTDARIDDPPVGPKVFLSACRWERTSDGAEDTDARGVDVLAQAPTGAAVDFGLLGGLDGQDLAVGGRAGRDAAAVRLTLSDGSVIDGAVANGYWLAWWQGPPTAAFTVTVLDAAGTVLSTTPVDPMATPSTEPEPGAGASPTAAQLAAVGLPASFGGWELVGSAAPIDPFGHLAEVIRAAGGDVTGSKDVYVEAKKGGEVARFDALVMPGADFAAFARATAPWVGQTGETVRTDQMIAGWEVVRFATPSGFVGPASSDALASRGDVLVLLTGDLSDDALRRLLSAWP